MMSKAEADEVRAARHIKYYARIGETRELVTIMSHSAKGQIPKWLLGRIAQEMSLSSRQLQRFVDCTLSRDEWLEIWESNPRQT